MSKILSHGDKSYNFPFFKWSFGVLLVTVYFTSSLGNLQYVMASLLSNSYKMQSFCNSVFDAMQEDSVSCHKSVKCELREVLCDHNTDWSIF